MGACQRLWTSGCTQAAGMHPAVVATAKEPAGLYLSLQLLRCVIVYMHYRSCTGGMLCTGPKGHMLRRCRKRHTHAVHCSWDDVQCVSTGQVLTSALLPSASLLC